MSNDVTEHLAVIKAEIKTWERSFRDRTGKNPGVGDIKAAKGMAEKYKLYKSLTAAKNRTVTPSIINADSLLRTPTKSQPKPTQRVQSTSGGGKGAGAGIEDADGDVRGVVLGSSRAAASGPDSGRRRRLNMHMNEEGEGRSSPASSIISGTGGKRSVIRDDERNPFLDGDGEGSGPDDARTPKASSSRLTLPMSSSGTSAKGKRGTRGNNTITTSPTTLPNTTTTATPNTTLTTPHKSHTTTPTKPSPARSPSDPLHSGLTNPFLSPAKSYHYSNGSPRRLKEILQANSRISFSGSGSGAGSGGLSGMSGGGGNVGGNLGVGVGITPRTKARKRLRGEEVEDTPRVPGGRTRRGLTGTSNSTGLGAGVDPREIGSEAIRREGFEADRGGDEEGLLETPSRNDKGRGSKRRRLSGLSALPSSSSSRAGRSPEEVQEDEGYDQEDDDEILGPTPQKPRASGNGFGNGYSGGGRVRLFEDDDDDDYNGEDTVFPPIGANGTSGRNGSGITPSGTGANKQKAQANVGAATSSGPGGFFKPKPKAASITSGDAGIGNGNGIVPPQGTSLPIPAVGVKGSGKVGGRAGGSRSGSGNAEASSSSSMLGGLDFPRPRPRPQHQSKSQSGMDGPNPSIPTAGPFTTPKKSSSAAAVGSGPLSAGRGGVKDSPLKGKRLRYLAMMEAMSAGAVAAGAGGEGDRGGGDVDMVEDEDGKLPTTGEEDGNEGSDGEWRKKRVVQVDEDLARELEVSDSDEGSDGGDEDNMDIDDDPNPDTADKQKKTGKGKGKAPKPKIKIEPYRLDWQRRLAAAGVEGAAVGGGKRDMDGVGRRWRRVRSRDGWGNMMGGEEDEEEEEQPGEILEIAVNQAAEPADDNEHDNDNRFSSLSLKSPSDSVLRKTMAYHELKARAIFDTKAANALKLKRRGGEVFVAGESHLAEEGEEGEELGFGGAGGGGEGAEGSGDDDWESEVEGWKEVGLGVEDDW